MIELWGRSSAYNVQKPLWLLQELELEYRQHEVGSKPGELETEAFLKLNPHARVPVLVDAGEVVCESNTILRYLAARYSPGELWPPDPLARSRAERWMDWELASLQPAFIRLFWSFYRTPEAQRDAVVIESARRRCGDLFGLLELQLEQQTYLSGDRFGLGDIPCAVCLYRYFNMGLEVEKPARVMDWYASIGERKAFKKTIMQPFEQLKGRLEY